MKQSDNIIILAVETSCDDTCAAVVRGRGKTESQIKILSNIVSSQIEVHKKWGGVYPTLAKREHQKNLLLVLKKALSKAKNPEINLIAVTIGPGLEPCLWVGVNFARALARSFNLPIIPINHIEAHIYANWLDSIMSPKFVIQFPAICLVVSGGHTQLILMSKTSKSRMRFGDHIKYEILGETRDDAAGECFDKIARILGLGYPGGPVIAKQAEKWKPQTTSVFQVALPRPMINQKNYDFSFSGLKTAVLYNFKNQPPKIQRSKQYIQQMCAEAQQAIIDVLIAKTIKAARNYKVKTVILGGGVAANQELRKQMKEGIKKEKSALKFRVPSPKFCTDNAAMIGVTAFFHWLKEGKKNWQEITAKANLRIG